MLYNTENIESIRVANQAVKEALDGVESLIAPGITTMRINVTIEKILRRIGAEFLFVGQRILNTLTPFPTAACVSVNEEVVHGVPNDYSLIEGDIVSIDCGTKIAGWCGDSARTWAVGHINKPSQKLIKATRKALDIAIAKIRPGLPWNQIAMLIQAQAKQSGFDIVRDFCGHGIGRKLHELPSVPNHTNNFMLDFILEPGLVIAIEPIFTTGTYHVIQKTPGEWPVVTRDGKRSAHFEHTIAVTSNGVDVLSG
jgi:methionyl aminopeptidase